MDTKTQDAHQPVLSSVPGEAPGYGKADWPAWCSTFTERKAYQQGIADARHIMVSEQSLHDVHTHRQAWRNALVAARDNAKAAANTEPDQNDADAAYWEHEIRAFDRCFETLAAMLPLNEGQH